MQNPFCDFDNINQQDTIVYMRVNNSLIVPSSGPSNINFPTVSTSSVLVTWSLPHDQDRNGIIQQYSVCAATSTDYLCDDPTITTNTWFEIRGLKPYQQIKFEIKAATAVGFGPATIVYQRTQPSGMYTV